jgi:hypothetical protein
MGNNLTAEENIILNLLLSKRGAVPVVEINNRKESVKEMQQRLYNNHNEYKALRATKKNKNK